MTTRPYSLLAQDDHERMKSAEYLADAMQILIHTRQDMRELEKYEQEDADQVRSIFLAMHSQVNELLQELRWKPWSLKDSRGRRKRVNKESTLSDAADVIMWLGAILTTLQEDYDIAPREIMYELAHKAPQKAERLRKQRV